MLYTAGAAWSGCVHPAGYLVAGPSVCRCATVTHRTDPRLTWLGGRRIQVCPCPCRARLISPNQGPATLIHSLSSEAWAVAATWARAVCSLASSRHHWALGLKSAGGGFVKEPFSFAVVIWTVHSLSSVVVPGRPLARPIEAYVENERHPAGSGSTQSLRASYVSVALRPIASRGAKGDRREPRPGRSGCHRGPRSTSQAVPRAPLRVPARPELRQQPAGHSRRGHPVPGSRSSPSARQDRPRARRPQGIPGRGRTPPRDHLGDRTPGRRPGPGRRGRSEGCGPGRRGAGGSGCSKRPHHHSSITMSDAGGQRRTRAVPPLSSATWPPGAPVRCRAEPCDLCAATRIHVGRATSGPAEEKWAICGVAWPCRAPLLLWWRQEVSP
jgi:hypothetical protein